MNLCGRPLADLEALLRRKEVSCADLVSDALTRIAEVNQHHLRAFMDNAIGCVILTTNHIHALDKGIRASG